MGKVVHDVVNELKAAHPDRKIEVDARGALNGQWDCSRMSQVLTNLVGNAIEHGSDRTSVTVAVQGDEKEVCVSIHNRGAAIPEDQMDGLFNAMKRQGMAGKSDGPSANLGLGLYIADQIVRAHKGRISVKSSEEAGTTFSVHLPRRA